MTWRWRWPRGRWRRGGALIEAQIALTVLALTATLAATQAGGALAAATAARDAANRAALQRASDAYAAATSTRPPAPALGRDRPGPWYPTGDGRPGPLAADAPDGTGATFVGDYARWLPEGTWMVDAHGRLHGPAPPPTP